MSYFNGTPVVEEVKRGEVYYIRMDSGIGAMQGAGRPGVVLTSDFGCENSPVVTIAYLTTSRKDMIVAVPVDCANRPAWVLCNQLITIDKIMLDRKMTKLTDEEMARVDDKLKLALGLREFEDNKVVEEEPIVEEEPREEMQLVVELEMYKRMYEMAMNMLVEKKVTQDIENGGVKLNVNTASWEELSLAGINANVAKEIISFRNKNGKFKSIEDLLNVPTVGPITFEKIEKLLTV